MCDLIAYFLQRFHPARRQVTVLQHDPRTVHYCVVDHFSRYWSLRRHHTASTSTCDYKTAQAVIKVQWGAGKRRSPTYRKWLKAFPDLMETESVIVPGYKIFFCISNACPVKEPNPNWSTVGLRDHIDD